MYFTLFAIVLFLATAAVFVWQARNQRPRILPFAVIVGGALCATFGAHEGAFYSAIALFAACSFLLVHQASQPFDVSEQEDASSKA